MSSPIKTIFALSGALALICGSIHAGPLEAELDRPDIKSAGALAFGPNGTLLIGDQLGATIFAVATDDEAHAASAINIDDLGGKIASLFGTTSDDILIHDLAVHPESGRVYLSTSRGRGPDAIPVILRLGPGDSIEEFSLDNVAYTKATLPNAPDINAKSRRGASLRMEAITDLAYFDGQVFVAGLSNEEFASTLRSLDYPFGDVSRGSSVEIYHGAHGRYETQSPIRTFMPLVIGGQPHLLAAYTCTPLVIIPIDQINTESHVKGRTVAELGNRNRPLDMILYQKDGESYVLMANSSRGVMKITTDNIESIDTITSRVGGGDTAGLAYDTIESLTGVVQLDKLDEHRAVVLIKDESGKLNLQTIDLP